MGENVTGTVTRDRPFHVETYLGDIYDVTKFHRSSSFAGARGPVTLLWAAEILAKSKRHCVGALSRDFRQPVDIPSDVDSLSSVTPRLHSRLPLHHTAFETF